MATEKWIAGGGVGLTWTSAVTASVLDSLANGNAVLSDVVVANATPFDMFADVSILFGSITAASPNFIGLYLAPLNQDGTTYGDGRFATAAAGPPSSPYWVGNFAFPTGAATIKGMVRGILLPPGSFSFLFYNQAGATLVGSGGNIAQYRTYNRQVV